MSRNETSVSLSSLSGARRTRAGDVAHANNRPPSNSNDDIEEFRATPALPTVTRAQQAAVLVSAFLAIVITIGYNQCYGVFQEYYLSETQDVLIWNSTDKAEEPPTALLAFVGTLGAGLTWAGSIFVNPWLSRVEYAALRRQHAATTSASGTVHRLLSHFRTPRGIALTGVVLMVIGFFLASAATQVWHLLLTQGLLYGLGSTMLYFPLLGPAPEYFTRHRATALGIMLSGGGVGGLVLTPVVRALLSAIGGRWTLRLMAGIVLVVGSPVAWVAPRSRFPVVAVRGQDSALDAEPGPLQSTGVTTGAPAPATMRRRTHISAALLTSPAFLLSVAMAFCQAAGAQLPLTFIPSYSVALGLSASTGATLLAVANVINATARVVTGYAGDRLGRLNVLAVTLAATTVAVGALWGLSVRQAAAAAATAPSLATQLWLAFVVLYSVAAGGYYALFPATIADIFGIRSYAAVNGVTYFMRGCGTMVGSPVGGVLLGKGSGSSGSGSGGGAYAGVVLWDGALLTGSVLCVLSVRWAEARRRGWVWRA